MTEIENLSISITANADRASAAIDRLAASMGKLKGASGNAASGIDNVKAKEDEVVSATQSVETEIISFADKLKRALGPLGSFASAVGKGLGMALKGAVSPLVSFISGIARIAKFRIYRAIVKDLGQSFKDLYGWSKLFGTDFAGSMNTINTSLVYLRNSIAAMVAPLVNALAPAVDFIVDKFVSALNLINEFFAAISGQATYTVARKVAKTWEDSFDSTGKSASSSKKKVDELKRTLLGFDEINRLDKPKSSSKSGGSGSGSSPYTEGYRTMFEQRAVSGGLKAVGDSLSKWVSTEIGKVEAIIDASAFAIGLILATHGQPAIGIGLMAAAALNAGANAVAYNDSITPKVKALISGILGLAGIGFAVGAVMAFTGGHIGLGIGLMAASIGALSGSYKIASVNWDSISKLLQGPIGTITALVSGALLAVGIIALIGGAIPLGIGLILAGAAGLVTSVAANWDNIKNMGKTAFKKLKEGWDSLAKKALELKAAIVTKAKELWDNLSAAWSNLREKVVTFAAKVANDARTWWGNIQAWWSETKAKVVTFAAKVANDAKTWWSNVQVWWSETKNKIVNFAAKVVNDAKTWWGNVSAWWSETKNKIVAFAARVVNDAKTWWGNVSAWWSETKNKIVSFAAQIVNDAKTWWGNVSAWWSGIKDKVVSFAAKVVNDAKTWWSNVSAWWSETKDKVVSFAAKIANNAATWWSNVKTWWSNTTTGKTVKEFVTEVKDKSATWWKNVVSWWKDAVNSTSIKEVSISILNEAATWWNNVVTWWKEMTSGKWLGIKILPSMSGESADMEEYAKTGGQYTQAWFDEHIKPLEDKARDTTLEVNVDANPTWENSWWGRTFGGGGGLLSYLNIDNLSTDVSVGVSTAWNLFWGILNFLGLDNLKATADVGVETVWGYWGHSLQDWIGLNNLDSTAHVDVETQWGYWGYSLRSWLGLDNLSATVYVSTAYTATGGVFSGGKWSDIPQYASGTANAHGSLFVAGEAGPEVVGHIGGRTEVLNKSQLAATMFSAVRAAMNGVEIAASFYNGVDDGESGMMEYIQANNNAIERQNELLRQQNEYLRQLNEKDTTVEISANSIARGLNRQNRRAGVTVVPVGT